MNHNHSHKSQQQIVNRLARIEGHVRAIKEMTKSERDCPDILLQIAAVRKALDNAAKIILKEHLEHCVVKAVQEGKHQESLDSLQAALNHFIR